MSCIAVFDIGTVTVRLGVFNSTDLGLVCKERKTSICNLGEGVAATGKLSVRAMDRVVETISLYLVDAQAQGATQAITTLTSAARDASNAALLLGRLSALGLKPNIIEGNVEGQLTFAGAALDFTGQPICVMDSGGGSTELCCGVLEQGVSHIDWVHSFDVGARRLTELFLDTVEPLEDGALAVCRAYVSNVIQRDMQKSGVDTEVFKGTQLIGVGGTATTLVALTKGLTPYNPAAVHLSELSMEAIEDQLVKLAQLPLVERTQLPGIQPKRASVICSGICTILEVMKNFKFNTLIVSENDLLCGTAIAAQSILNRQSVWHLDVSEFRS